MFDLNSIIFLCGNRLMSVLKKLIKFYELCYSIDVASLMKVKLMCQYCYLVVLCSFEC